METYFDRLWPICRSITGNGLRESFRILQEIIPLQLHEVPSGTSVFDWTVPPEWNISDAYIITPNGKKIADFQVNNLHLVNYSIPQQRELSYEELLPHLYYLEDQPNAIPYVTSYYKRHWGFCLSYEEFKTLSKEGKYQIFIESSLDEKGALTYGDLVLPGNSEEEILFSSYLCHPSLAVNELSGPLVTAFLYEEIAKLENRRYTYRFVIAPETIGIIAFLARVGQDLLAKLRAGYVVTCVGHEGAYTYKRSKRGDSLADRVAEHVLRFKEAPVEVMDFAVGGSDERQYCSPGFNLPVGSLMRTMYKVYPEYHTSLDNKELISFKGMAETVATYMEVVKTLELNQQYTNTVPFCEPQLGKRGLYDSSASWMKDNTFRNRLLHFLSYADGTRDLLEIAEKKGVAAAEFAPVIAVCRKHQLI